MIVDCFSFFNELDLLEIRLNVLSPHVDKFVLVEAAKTQSLRPKPFIFEENKERFKDFLDRIHHVKLEEEDCPKGDFKSLSSDWSMEHLQRNSVMKGLGSITMKKDDIVLISDLDEIPNLIKLGANLEMIRSKRLTSFTQNTYSYFLNMKCYDVQDGNVIEKISRATLGITRSMLDIFHPQELWKLRDTTSGHLSPRGWHFSWLGGLEKIREKSLSCIEPYDKSIIPSKEGIEEIFNRRVFKEGFWNINEPEDDSVIIKKLRDESALPQYVRDNKEKFKHLFTE